MKPHKHSELIKAWADGAEIEVLDNHMEWQDIGAYSSWNEQSIYRIKPQSKPDVVKYAIVDGYSGMFCKQNYDRANIKLTFDGETGELKSAEVLK
jgi:hypothetical protein